MNSFNALKRWSLVSMVPTIEGKNIKDYKNVSSNNSYLYSDLNEDIEYS